jgi:uncharacterized repeat protein (TIGR01451 family)
VNVDATTKRLIALLLAVVLAASVLTILTMMGSASAQVSSSAGGASAQVSTSAGRASAQNMPPLGITKVAYPTPPVTIPVGRGLDFVITETNNTNTTFPEVAVRDWLPNEVTFFDASASQGECFYSPFVHNVFCELGDIPAGGSAFVYITVIPRTPGTFTNTAWDILNNRADANFIVTP